MSRDLFRAKTSTFSNKPNSAHTTVVKNFKNESYEVLKDKEGNEYEVNILANNYFKNLNIINNNFLQYIAHPNTPTKIGLVFTDFRNSDWLIHSEDFTANIQRGLMRRINMLLLDQEGNQIHCCLYRQNVSDINEGKMVDLPDGRHTITCPTEYATGLSRDAELSTLNGKLVFKIVSMVDTHTQPGIAQFFVEEYFTTNLEVDYSTPELDMLTIDGDDRLIPNIRQKFSIGDAIFHVDWDITVGKEFVDYEVIDNELFIRAKNQYGILGQKVTIVAEYEGGTLEKTVTIRGL